MSRHTPIGGRRANWPSGLAGAKEPVGRRRPIELVYALLGKIPRSVMMPLAVFGHGLMQARQLRGIKRNCRNRLTRTREWIPPQSTVIVLARFAAQATVR
jgi:hypothetical protein